MKFDRSRYEASVDGTIEGAGQTIRITAIHIHYRLRIPRGTREEAERALRVHEQGCPASQSVKDAIRISHDAEIEEFEPAPDA